MNILLAILEAISESFLFLTIVFMLLESGSKMPERYIKRFALIVVVICAFSLIFHVTFDSQPKAVQFIMLVINYLKFLLCSTLFFNHISVKGATIVVLTQSLCELLTSVLFLFFPQHYVKNFATNIIIVFVCRLIFFISIYAIWKRKLSTSIHAIPTYILFIMLINIFFTSGLIRTAEFEWRDTELKNFLIKILAFANTLCLIVVLVSLLTNVLFRQYQKDINKILENQVQIQLKHYEKSEKINTEIRRFRHDYNNHMNCMKSLVQSGRYDELMDYINNISDAFPQSGFLYNTGNYIADAILTDKLENARKNGTNISFKGIISPSINNTYLCIILGNILDNAVEACEKIDGEKEISVFGGYQHGYFILIAKNPISCHVQTENGIPATTKPDTAYHGFGLQNVESVVKKYDGIMLPECSDDSFTIRLTFNSIQETATV